MKKKRTLIIVLSVIVLGTVGYQVFLKRTPERILKTNYDLSLKGFDYSVTHFEEQWCPNGDGYVDIAFIFNKLTPENLDYLKGMGANPLPTADSLQTIIPNRFTEIQNGLYFFTPLSESDDRDYRVFIINTDTKEAFFYYRIM